MVALTYRTADPDWGAGKGAALTAAEVDRNFHNLRLAAEAMQVGPAGAGILAMTQQDRQVTVTYTDGRTDQLILPVGDLVHRGVWDPLTPYANQDLVTWRGGCYLCISGHTAGTVWWEDYRAGRWALLAGLSCDSQTEVTVQTSAQAGGALSWEVPAGLGLEAGMAVRITSAGADPGQSLDGTVIALDAAAGSWWLRVDVAAVTGGGVLTDPVIRLASGSPASPPDGPTAASGAWTAVSSVGGVYDVLPADVGTLLEAADASTIRLPATGFAAGDGLWVKAASDQAVLLQTTAGTLEPPYSFVSLSGERAWLVHQGAGEWRLAVRTPLAGQFQPPQLWQYRLDLTGDVFIQPADFGVLITAEHGATITLPTVAQGAEEGATVWLGARPDHRARVTVVVPGGWDDLPGQGSFVLTGEIVALVSDAVGTWTIAARRRLNHIQDPPSLWRETREVAAATAVTATTTDVGLRWSLAAGASVALPLADQWPDGVLCCVSADGTGPASVQGSFAGGGNSLTLDQSWCILAADAGATPPVWRVVAQRPHGAATVAALTTSGLTAPDTGGLTDAAITLSSGNSYSDSAVQGAVQAALDQSNRNVAALAGQLQALRAQLVAAGLFSS